MESLKDVDCRRLTLSQAPSPAIKQLRAAAIACLPAPLTGQVPSRRDAEGHRAIDRAGVRVDRTTDCRITRFCRSSRTSHRGRLSGCPLSPIFGFALTRLRYWERPGRDRTAGTPVRTPDLHEPGWVYSQRTICFVREPNLLQPLDGFQVGPPLVNPVPRLAAAVAACHQRFGPFYRRHCVGQLVCCIRFICFDYTWVTCCSRTLCLAARSHEIQPKLAAMAMIANENTTTVARIPAGSR